MLGEIVLCPGGRGRVERAELAGLRVLRTEVKPEGLMGRLALRRGARGLARLGVSRVLAPAGFDRWDYLAGWGLRPVDVIPFLWGAAPRLALAALKQEGAAPGDGTVALRSPAASPAVEGAARALCPLVRQVVLDVPRGGTELAGRLRREFGMPVAPDGPQAQVALCYHPHCRRDWGRTVPLWRGAEETLGVSIRLPGRVEEDNLPLLAALWEAGRVGEGELEFT